MTYGEASTWRFLALLAAASAFAVGCAPPAHLRPASALVAEQRNEVGLGLAAITPRPYVDEPTYHTGQLWYSRRFGSLLRGSLVTAFDLDALAGGVAVAVIPFRTPRFAGGAEAEVGFAWAAGSFPVAVRLFDETWLYAAPRLSNWGSELTPAAIAGLSVGIFGGFVLRGEAQASWADFDPYNRRYHVAGSGVFQW